MSLCVSSPLAAVGGLQVLKGGYAGTVPVVAMWDLCAQQVQ